MLQRRIRLYIPIPREFVPSIEKFFLDLEFCSVFGATPEKALAELKKAKSAWLKAAKANGKKIPTPRYRPALYQAVG